MPAKITESQNFFNQLEHRLPEADLEKVKAAYIFSKYGHRNQERDGGGRYFDHPREVCNIITGELGFFEGKIIIAALLHDILEDSWLLSERRLAINFGKEVA